MWSDFDTEPYAWRIDVDHLDDDGYDVGRQGPSDAPDKWLEILNATPKRTGHVHADVRIYTFRMYDDDGELYYTGRMITSGDPSEEACYGPLGDYGMPGAGATEIRYHGHPEMNCG